MSKGLSSCWPANWSDEAAILQELTGPNPRSTGWSSSAVRLKTPSRWQSEGRVSTITKPCIQPETGRQRLGARLTPATKLWLWRPTETA